MERISITEKFARFAEHWQRKIIAELNGQEVKLIKVQNHSAASPRAEAAE
jgi:hypothetical protein